MAKPSETEDVGAFTATTRCCGRPSSISDRCRADALGMVDREQPDTAGGVTVRLPFHTSLGVRPRPGVRSGWPQRARSGGKEVDSMSGLVLTGLTALHGLGIVSPSPTSQRQLTRSDTSTPAAWQRARTPRRRRAQPVARNGTAPRAIPPPTTRNPTTTKHRRSNAKIAASRDPPAGLGAKSFGPV